MVSTCFALFISLMIYKIVFINSFFYAMTADYKEILMCQQLGIWF